MRLFTIMILSLLMFSFTFSQSNAFIKTFNFFNVFEVNFNINEEKNNKINNNINDVDLVVEESVEAKDIENIEDNTIKPIDDIVFVNSKMYLYLDEDFNHTNYEFYINGYLKKDFGRKNFKKERYYGNDTQIVYSIEDKFYDNYIYSGLNFIYFKNKNTNKDTEKYRFYKGDLVKYDTKKNEFICKGDIEKIVILDGYGDVKYIKEGKFGNDLFLSLKTGDTKLKKGYYNSYLYCKIEEKEVYYIYNLSFIYSALYESIDNRTVFGKYYTKKEYENKKNNNTN